MKRFLLLLVVVLVAFSPQALAGTATIYESTACGHCTPYVSGLKQLLQQNGFSIVEKDYVNDLGARNEWNSFHEKKGIPLELRGHMLAVLNGSVALEGHVPVKAVEQLIKEYPLGDFPSIVLFQDDMGESTTFKVFFEGKTTECSVGENILECADIENKQLPLPLIVGFSGLLAGIHPCTIGVLLFFLAFLFAIRRTRLNALKVGAAYIAGVFAAYFLIGLGLLKAVSFAEPHLAAKAAAVLVIALGAISIARYFFPQIRGFSIPGKAKQEISVLVQRASVPAALVVGIIVGVCSFGCTVGIYAAVIGLLATEPALGTAYLLLYNLLFIVPLVAVLLIATNKAVVERIEKAEKKNAGLVGLVSGIAMIVLGFFILFIVGAIL